MRLHLPRRPRRPPPAAPALFDPTQYTEEELNLSTVSDGIPDVWKIFHGFDIEDITLASADYTGDGITNFWKYALNLYPLPWAEAAPAQPAPAPQPSITAAAPAATPQITAASSPPATPSASAAAPLLKNGSFSISSDKLTRTATNGYDSKKTGFKWAFINQTDSGGWRAVEGNQVEFWEAEGNQFVELNASATSRGIKQKVTVTQPGTYMLVWKHRGRTSEQAVNAYTASVYTQVVFGGIVLKSELASNSFPVSPNVVPKGKWETQALAFTVKQQDPAPQGGYSFWIAFQPKNTGTYGTLIDDVSLLPVEMMVDANGNGTIDDSDRGKVTEQKPWSFWLNDDDDVNGVNGWQQADNANSKVDGEENLKDFFPVFLDIQQVVQAFPPSPTVKYKLKQADAAVNYVETKLTRQTAFSYKDNTGIGYGDFLQQTAGNARTTQVPATGVELSELFLNNIKNDNKGVILFEGRAPTTKPLVLTVEENGVERLQVSLPLALNARILLLLHGMNSSTHTWNAFVQNQIGYPTNKWATDIRVEDGEIAASQPMLTAHGVRCYRLQFGGYENGGNTQTGLEGLTAANAPDYRQFRGTKQCGDFETFGQLGQEVNDAISVLLAKPEYRNAQITLVGHSRGGIAARAFLQTPGDNPRKSAVVGLLTTGTPHSGSRMGRIYQWLKDNPRPIAPATNDDWEVVQALLEKGGLDLRRPVNGDVADNSPATVNLNLPAEIAKMPASIRYGQIVYSKSDLGRLQRVLVPGTSTYFVYSVFDGRGIDLGPQLSDAAQTYLLAGVAPAGYPGDGLIPWQNQRFPADLHPDAGQVFTLTKDAEDVLHVEEPLQTQDLRSQLLVLMRPWFLYP